MAPFHAVVNDLKQTDVLGIHFLKYVSDAFGVLPGHREDDRLAGELAALVEQAVLHDLLPLFAERAAVAHVHFDFCTSIVDLVRVDTLLDEGVSVLLAEVHTDDAVTLETGLGLIKPEVHETFFRDSLRNVR